MKMQNNTKFGNKIFAGLENIMCISIDIFTLRSDFDLEHSNFLLLFFFPQDILAYSDVL